MPRTQPQPRDPFEDLRDSISTSPPITDAPASHYKSVLDGIPTKKKNARARDWEKKNPSVSFFVPENIWGSVIAKKTGIRDRLSVVADRERVIVDQVSLVIVAYALYCFERGDIQFIPRPHPTRRKMTLSWDEVDESFPVFLPAAVQDGGAERQPKQRKRYYTLAYRWGETGEAQHEKIKKIASEYYLSTGEVLIRLLEFGVGRYEVGRLQLTKVFPESMPSVGGYEEKEK